VEYADFCRLVQKGEVVTLTISGLTGPIFIKLAHEVATTLPLDIFESNLPYFTRFGTPACRIKIILPIFPKFDCHGNVP